MNKYFIMIAAFPNTKQSQRLQHIELNFTGLLALKLYIKTESYQIENVDLTEHIW